MEENTFRSKSRPLHISDYIRIISSIILIISFLPIFGMVVVVSRIVTLPFPKWVYHKIDNMWYSSLGRIILFHFFTATRTKLCYSGDWKTMMETSERVLYLSNHMAHMDWTMGVPFAIRQPGPCVPCFVFVSRVKYLPLIGYYFYSRGFVHINQKSFSAESLENELEFLTRGIKHPWLVMFPEGRYYNPNEHNIIKHSQTMAFENNLQVLQNHLTPRYKGTFLTLKHLRGYIDAVYDVTIVYENCVNDSGRRTTSPDVMDIFTGRCPSINIHCRRIPVENIPVEENEFKLWLHQMFINKDNLVKDFYSSDSNVRESAWKQSEEHPILLRETIPSVAFYAFVQIVLLYFGLGFWFAIMMIVIESLAGYGWLKIKRAI